jgi:hypothetical protein
MEGQYVAAPFLDSNVLPYAASVVVWTRFNCILCQPFLMFLQQFGYLVNNCFFMSKVAFAKDSTRSKSQRRCWSEDDLRIFHAKTQKLLLSKILEVLCARHRAKMRTLCMSGWKEAIFVWCNGSSRKNEGPPKKDQEIKGLVLKLSQIANPQHMTHRRRSTCLHRISVRKSSL